MYQISSFYIKCYINTTISKILIGCFSFGISIGPNLPNLELESVRDWCNLGGVRMMFMNLELNLEH